MDAYHHQRQFAGPGDAPPPPQPPSQPNPQWYPGPGPAPPYPPHANHPFPPQHQQWGPPNDPQHQRHLPPPPPQQQPPYGYQPFLPPMPMPMPPPTATGSHWPPHHAGLQPPPPSYPPPPPGQAWTNHSWAQNHGYAGHVNEDDWATKAKEWAAAKSVTENHHIQQHAISTSRPEVHHYAYHDRYHQPAGPPTELLRPPIPQSSNEQMPFQMTGQHRETNYFPDGGSLAPPANIFSSFPSTYEQEVSYNYSSAPGNGNASLQYPSTQAQPSPAASSVQDGYPRAPSSMPVAPALEQPRFGHDGLSSRRIVDPSDQPLEFDSQKAPDMAVHNATSFSSTVPAASVAANGHGAVSASNQSWMDPSVHGAPLFGAVSGSNYVPPLAFGVASMTEAFPVDANTPFNVAERSKKPPVPNWLREELLKKKSTPLSASVQHSTDFHSVGSEDAEKTLKGANPIVDNRSADSAKSTDDEDDEDEIEAARMAAINQEIKRVLTEVLLKVTDELFDEIATKVLDEDDSSAEPNEPSRVSSSKGPGLGESKSKSSAKVVIPAKPTDNSSADHPEDTGLSSPKGALLGLASYDSDDESDDGDGSNKIPMSNLSSKTKAAAGERSIGDEQHRNCDERKSSIQNASSVEDHKFNGEESQRNSNEESERQLVIHETHSKEFPLDVKTAIMTKDVVPKIDEKSNGHLENGKDPSVNHAEKYNNLESSHKEDFVKEGKAVCRKEANSNPDKYNDDEKSSTYGNVDKNGFKEEQGSVRNAKHGADTREPRPKGDRNSSQKGERERNRDTKDRREKGKDEKEDRSRQITKSSTSHSSRRSRSPSERSRTRKESSSHVRGSTSSDEPSDNVKRRKFHSRKSSMSPSPPKSRSRRVSRSPHSKHSHRRHSPYSSAERKKHSRSRTPVKRR